MAGVVFIWHRSILSVFENLKSRGALDHRCILGLASLWLPVFRGLLQGRQNFLGLGWIFILDGVGRFIGVALAVQRGGQAAGGMLARSPDR